MMPLLLVAVLLQDPPPPPPPDTAAIEAELAGLEQVVLPSEDLDALATALKERVEAMEKRARAHDARLPEMQRLRTEIESAAQVVRDRAAALATAAADLEKRAAGLAVPDALKERLRKTLDRATEAADRAKRAPSSADDYVKKAGTLVAEAEFNEERYRILERAIAQAGGSVNAVVLATTGPNENEDRAFAGYAQRLANRYRANGLKPVALQIHSVREAMHVLDLYAKRGGKIESIVMFGHGGWDGTTMGRSYRDGIAKDPIGQVSPTYNAEEYRQFVDLLKTATRPGALFVGWSCHSAGDNAAERASSPDKRIWTRSLAEDAKLHTVGAQGATAMENVTKSGVIPLLEQALQYGLTGGRSPQQTWFAAPGGAQVPAGFNWYQQVFAKRRQHGGVQGALRKALED